MRYFLLFWLAALLGRPVNAQLISQHVYGTAGEETGGLLTPIRAGGFLLLGSQQRTSLTAFNEKMLLVRTTAQGDTLWSRAHNLPGFTVVQPRGICENTAGQVLVALSGGDANVGFADEAMLVLLNAQGDTLWTRRTNGPTIDSYHGLTLGNDGNFVLVGRLNTFPQWLKINAAGQVVARTDIAYESTDVGNVITLFPDNTTRGGYWVINSKTVQPAARKLLHLTEAGVVDETKPLYTAGSFRSVAPVPSQQGYLATESSNGRLVRLSATLDTLWTRQLRYTSPNGLISGQPSAQLVQPLPDGNFVVAGGFFYQTGTRVYLGKITPAGRVLRDTVLFRLGGSELVQGLAVAPGTGRYVFSGYATQGPRGGADLFLGVHANWNVLSTRAAHQAPVRSLEAWPNPLAGATTLHLRTSQPLAGELRLLDALGRVVCSWPATREVATPAGQPLELAGVPPGLYLLTGHTPDGQRYATRLLRE